ncbi:unnamed protein product [Linum trigynum]|uniref:Uncharacterized protein n=1 Tax=Linum trigynum TaxID=586398 RepID=A0AAV2E9S0_9ROSI
MTCFSFPVFSTTFEYRILLAHSTMEHRPPMERDPSERPPPPPDHCLNEISEISSMEGTLRDYPIVFVDAGFPDCLRPTSRHAAEEV